MKRVIYSKVFIISFFLFVFANIGFSQNNSKSKYYIVGTWLRESLTAKGDLILKRKIVNQNSKTTEIVISNNGIIFENIKSNRRCGNDFRMTAQKENGI